MAAASLDQAGAERVRARLRALGFDAVRFARAEPLFGPGLKAWIEAGNHADMGWLERGAEKRGDPDLVLPGVRTVIMLGVNYGVEQGAGTKQGAGSKERGASKGGEPAETELEQGARSGERGASKGGGRAETEQGAGTKQGAGSGERGASKGGEPAEMGQGAPTSRGELGSGGHGAGKGGTPEEAVAMSEASGLGSSLAPRSLLPAPSSLAWARYARYSDYHDTIVAALAEAGLVLEAEGGIGPDDHRYYVDTGPVLERGWAARAGLGFTGKNAMLISREFGNWLFLASILTRLELPADAPLPGRAPEGTHAGQLCGKCTRCLDACPTDAFTAPGVVDARRCVAYQTIENKGVIPRELRAGIGNRIYGCDTCLEVCPWNRFAQASREMLITSRPEITRLTLAEVLELTPMRFAEIFRKTPIKRTKLAGLLRNACIVAGNTDATECVPQLARLADPREAMPGGTGGAPYAALVRAHAVWALARLGERARLTELAGVETDTLVREEYAAEGF